MRARFADVGDYLCLNLSCPNTADGREYFGVVAHVDGLAEPHLELVELPGEVRDLVHAGVHDYLVKPISPQALAEALELRPGQAGAPISQRLAKLVALVGARGGVGTTTIAANLAWYLANRQNRRVALLDLNLQRGDCALALNVTPTAGLR